MIHRYIGQQYISVLCVLLSLLFRFRIKKRTGVSVKEMVRKKEWKKGFLHFIAIFQLIITTGSFYICLIFERNI